MKNWYQFLTAREKLVPVRHIHVFRTNISHFVKNTQEVKFHIPYMRILHIGKIPPNLLHLDSIPILAELICYERDSIVSLSDNNQTDIIEAFNSTSRYLDDILNIDYPYFEQMVGQIYPTELQLSKASSSDTEAPFLDLNLSITNGIVSSKLYN